MTDALVARVAVLSLVTVPLTGQMPPLRAQEVTALHARVVQAADTSISIPRARVTVSSVASGSVTAYGDDEGRFTIEGVPPLTLTIARAGFVTQTVRFDRPLPATPIELRLAKGGTITGRAIGSDGRPAVAAAVRILPMASANRAPEASDPITVHTNDLGEFRAAGLAPGRYELRTFRDVEELSRLRTNEVNRTTWHGGPLPASADTSARTRPLVVNVEADGEHAVTVPYGDMSLDPPHPSWTAAVTGLVLDDRGRPAEGVKVRLWYLGRDGPGLRASQVGPSQVTDDLGRFRLFHVQPGSYVVEVVASNAWMFPGVPRSEPAPVYYPGVTSITQAVHVQVTRDQELSGVHIVFARRRLARVHGVAADASGMPLTGTVGLVGAAVAGGIRHVPREVTTQDGSFEFTNVAPGEYVVRATRARVMATRVSSDFSMRSSSASDFGYLRLSVGEFDEGPLTVTAAPTATLTGRIVFKGDAPPASPISLSLRPVDPALAPNFPLSGAGLRVADDGRFEIPGFAGSSYLDYLGPAGWYVKSILTPVEIAGFEPIDPWLREITVVLARATAAFSGQVLDGTRPPARRHMALLVPVNEALRNRGPSYQGTGLAAQDGRFTYRDMAPGEYYVLAIDPEALGTQEIRDLIRSHGRRITLRAGQELTLTLPAFPGTP